jgi:formate hydrogenlyase subunit 3/multisubunit Na+/H+ antiporter MnhD subunit
VTGVYAAAMVALALGPLAAIVRERAAAALTALGCGLLVLVGLTAALGGAHPVLDLGSWLGFGTTALRADGLAGIFLALTGVTGAAASLGYAELPQGRYPVALHGVLVLAVATVIGTGNAFAFFLAWEALGLCVYLIAGGDRGNPRALAAGYFAGGLTKLGGAALLAAIGLLYGRTHSLALADWLHAAGGLPTGTRSVAFVLLVAAFATKVGLVPLHGALPSGYGAAPGSGAASLSVALCAGYYGLWRLVYQTLAPAPAWWGDALLVVAALTAFTGILYAITRDDLRRFLGFSTVEHAGIAAMGLGVALLGQAAGNRTLAAAGLLAATLHVVAHGLAKTLALLTAARLERETGERALSRLGGLGAALPASAAGLGLATLTLAALPPLGGFVSEWFTFAALLQGFRLPHLLSQLLCALAAAMLALTAGLGLLAFAKLLGFSFLGAARSRLPRAPLPLPASLLGLGAIVLALGTVAPWEIHLLGSGLSGLLGFDPADAVITHPLTLGPVFADFSVLAPTWLSIVLPAYALLAALYVRVLRAPVRRAPVWVSGSGAELAAVQYRPSAYSNPIRVVLRGPLGFTRRLIAEDDGRLRLETRVVLATDRFVYRPASWLALRGAALVRRTQSGSLSAYLLYMLAVLILVLALVPALS